MSEKKYFDKHWNTHNHVIPNEKIKVARNFLFPVLSQISNRKEFNRFKILDVGCGDGVHYQVIDNLNSNIDFSGIDISDEVISSLKKMHNKKNNAHFVPADALKLPFSDELFDTVFSFGVLGYTPDPYKGFVEKVRVLKTGGKIGIWLYPIKSGISGLIFNFIRFIAINSPDYIKARIADLIVPFLYFLPTRSGLNLSNATFAQCREVVMVNIAPDDLVFFDKEQIINWFIKNNIKIDYDDEKNPITIWGTKL